MAKRKKKAAKSEDPKLEIAPMLDVTFLLLIFFICTIKFKTLEGRLDAYLPKDMGSQRTNTEALENIEVRLKPKGSGDTAETTVYVGRTPVERITNMNAKEEVDLPNLYRVVGDLHNKLPDQPCVIDPDRGVPNGHVVAVLNTVMRHRIEKITFTMPPPQKKK